MCPNNNLGARARAGVIFLLSAYSLSYLISIYRRCFCQGVWPVRAVQRAAGATATGPWTAVCVRSMSFSIHFYQTRPHRHACANRQRRNRSGLVSQRAPPHPPPRASNRRTLHTTHNSTAWRLRRHHCRQSSLRRKSGWALPLRRAQSGSRTTRTLCASAPRDSNCGPWPAV